MPQPRWNISPNYQPSFALSHVHQEISSILIVSPQQTYHYKLIHLHSNMRLFKSYRFHSWEIVSHSEGQTLDLFITFTCVTFWTAQLQQLAKWSLSFYCPSLFSPTSNCNTGHHNLVNVCIHLKNKTTCHIFINNHVKMSETLE